MNENEVMSKAMKKQETSLPDVRPTWMKGDGTRGNEGVSTDDMTVPRIAIIQDLSPQHKKSKEEYINGAEPRMAFNTATKELYGSSLQVIPVLFRKEWVIWKDIDAGGGFKGAYPNSGEASNALSELEDEAQCEIVDTAQHFVMIVGADGKLSQAVISMSKSQMKPSRSWNTMIQSAGGDRFERSYTLEVVDAQNANGQDYYNWKVSPQGYVTEDQFIAAERLYENIKAGALDVKRDEAPASKAPAEGAVNDDSEF